MKQNRVVLDVETMGEDGGGRAMREKETIAYGQFHVCRALLSLNFCLTLNRRCVCAINAAFSLPTTSGDEVKPIFDISTRHGDYY